MCDAEHMFECPTGQDNSDNGQQNFESFLASQFQTPQEHKNLVAKKFQVKKVSFLLWKCNQTNSIINLVIFLVNKPLLGRPKATNCRKKRY